MSASSAEAPPTQVFSRRTVLTKLVVLIDERLFDSDRWWPDDGTALAIRDRLEPLGLTEPVPGSPGSTRQTTFGMQIDARLLEWAFLGMCESWMVPEVLMNFRLMSFTEMRRLQRKLFKEDVDPEVILRVRVQKAYIAYFNPVNWLH